MIVTKLVRLNACKLCKHEWQSDSTKAPPGHCPACEPWMEMKFEAFEAAKTKVAVNLPQVVKKRARAIEIID